jgi:hypothetical protein
MGIEPTSEVWEGVGKSGSVPQLKGNGRDRKDSTGAPDGVAHKPASYQVTGLK